jgi:hypothetical protein
MAKEDKMNEEARKLKQLEEARKVAYQDKLEMQARAAQRRGEDE